MVRSQATTMNSRNKNGRTHAAFSAFDTPLSRFSSATSRSLMIVFFGEINPLDKYWQAGFRAVFCRSCERRNDGSHRLMRWGSQTGQCRLAEIRGRFSRQRGQHQRHHVGEAFVPRLLLQEVATEDHGGGAARG